MVNFDPIFTTCGAAKILAELANTGPRKRCSMMRSYFTYQEAKKATTRSDSERKRRRAIRTMGSRASKLLCPRLLPRWPALPVVGIFSLMAMETTVYHEQGEFLVRG